MKSLFICSINFEYKLSFVASFSNKSEFVGAINVFELIKNSLGDQPYTYSQNINLSILSEVIKPNVSYDNDEQTDKLENLANYIINRES